jgi:hypothetical protein
MDARTFEPDEPLPRICKHCKWLATVPGWGNTQGLCILPRRLENSGRPVRGVMTYVSHTCDQWEEKA